MTTDTSMTTDASDAPTEEFAAPTIGADTSFPAVGFVTGISSPISQTHPEGNWTNEEMAARTLSCSGVLIAPQIALTQASCLASDPQKTRFALNPTGDALAHPDRTVVYVIDDFHLSPGGEAVLHLAVGSDQPMPAFIATPLFAVTANDANLSPFGQHSGAGALLDGGSLASVTASWRVEGASSVVRRVRTGVASLPYNDIQLNEPASTPIFSSDLGAPVLTYFGASVTGTQFGFGDVDGSTLMFRPTFATNEGAWLEQILWLFDEAIDPAVALPPPPGGYSWVRLSRTRQDGAYADAGAQDPEPAGFYAAGSQPNPTSTDAGPETLGICVTWTGVAQQPGKYWWHGGCAYDASGGEAWADISKVLAVTGTTAWSQAPGGTIATGSFAPGYTGLTPLFTCRASYMGGVHPGFVTGGSCHITWGGQEQVFSAFETLAIGP